VGVLASPASRTTTRDDDDDDDDDDAAVGDVLGTLLLAASSPHVRDVIRRNVHDSAFIDRIVHGVTIEAVQFDIEQTIDGSGSGGEGDSIGHVKK
jgi:hypothetical protein